MASSNHQNIQDTRTHAHDNNSKFADPKHDPKPNSQHGDEPIKQASSKVDAALRFLKSVFEDGDSSTNKKGHFHIFGLLKLNTYVF